MELNLRFPNVNQVVVKFDDQETDALDFVSPLTEVDLKEIQWYLETYSAYYTSDPDDARSQRLETNLEKWGADLFNTVFASRAAQRIFNDFQDEDEEPKLLTIAASHPFILSLPWELLRDPEGTYLVHDNPRISVRRKLAEAEGSRRPLKVRQKETVRILFVTSRPTGAGFIDPRAEAIPVLDAIAKEGKGRIDVEFLRPATLVKLIERLSDESLPSIDIFHFDGHGVYDKDGNLYQQAKTTDPNLRESDLSKKPNTGYLLFEDEGNHNALITAETLGETLNRYGVGIVVLSACQSAKVAGEDPMGSVAARLTHCGISAVLAMTHSVLVTTATQLFSKFYEELVQGKGMGEALDNARLDLYSHRFRLNKWYGERLVEVNLQDWFLPALYQVGEDTPLLTPDWDDTQIAQEEQNENTNLPQVQQSGFWGRTGELWDIERWFVQGKERVTISGFGGQGKTYLAQESGRWLYRTGLFQKVCFVDYSAFQGIDGLSYAVAMLNLSFHENFIDADAVQKYLHDHQELSFLVILDNLEVLESESLQILLAAAKEWSEVGNCRLIITTRQGDLQMSGYETRSIAHKAITLDGLSSGDAINYFNALVKLPPEPQIELPQRDALIELFERVDFHPLSIGLLARQLKTRRIGELGLRLERVLDELPGNENKSLRASLQLSLDRLDGQARELLPKLGVFQGGAMEHMLLAITEFEEGAWRELRDSLVAVGLITLEHLPNISIPYVRFHPTLAPALWEKSFQHTLKRQRKALIQWHREWSLKKKRKALIKRHREQYYQLSYYLYFEDRKNPYEARAMAMSELSNLLYGVKGALAAKTNYAVEFAECLSVFLVFFGMRDDCRRLIDTATTIGAVGSRQWYLAQRGRGAQLYSQGRLQEATIIFSDILAQRSEKPSYERFITLAQLGRCFKSAGQAVKAIEFYQQGIAVGKQLEQSNNVKRQISNIWTDLGHVLESSGEFAEARKAYETSLEIGEKTKDFIGMAATNGQLGTLAMLEGDRREAIERYETARDIFQTLNEPAMEAVSWHQLGMVYEQSRQWEEAEQHYRQAAFIWESQGNLQKAVLTWTQLGNVCQYAGKLAAAEDWYRKALQQIDDSFTQAKIINNLAHLLRNDPARLPEARQLAEKAMRIRKTLDPRTAEIWQTYAILADITENQGEIEQSKKYRRLARESLATYAGNQNALKRFSQVIVGAVRAIVDPEARQQMDEILADMAQDNDDWQRLSRVIPRIWDGERDFDSLCETLQPLQAVIVEAILEGINNPDSLQRFLE